MQSDFRSTESGIGALSRKMHLINGREGAKKRPWLFAILIGSRLARRDSTRRIALN
jgi:hypothetical protein